MAIFPPCTSFFFFNDPATTEIYTLSLHDALPICGDSRPSSPTGRSPQERAASPAPQALRPIVVGSVVAGDRSEEHTSELQSLTNLVCRLLLEKKKKLRMPDVIHHGRGGSDEIDLR